MFLKLTVLTPIAIVLIVSGCGKPAPFGQQGGQPANGHWEMVWAEPKVVASDTLFTLLRSDWVDSFYVAQSGNQRNHVPTLSFFVDANDCFVSANLIDGSQSIIQPLIALNLPYGYYKLTFNLAAPAYGPSPEQFAVSLRTCIEYRVQKLFPH